MSIKIVTKIPSAALSPNSRSHWRVKHAASKSSKKVTVNGVQVALALLHETPDGLPWHEVELQATYYHNCKRRRDPDNLVALLKYPIDGLVAGGLLVDDDQITLKPVIRLIDKDNPRLEMTVTPLHPPLSGAASEEPKQ
jgi:Holliday junction resolvase RusA-like endonuclease